MWGMDILGPFSPGKGQVKFLLVAVDYFTKWIEAEPLATITAQQVQKFVWHNLICRFGVPKTIITDNGRQFIDKGLADFYKGLHIHHVTSSVEHPQTNGQAEAANKVILKELKKRLGEAKGTWADSGRQKVLGCSIIAIKILSPGGPNNDFKESCFKSLKRLGVCR